MIDQNGTEVLDELGKRIRMGHNGREHNQRLLTGLTLT